MHINSRGYLIATGWLAQAAEPAIRQIDVHFLTQSTFGANAKAISDDPHADHQFRGNGGPAGVTVELSQVLAQVAKIEISISAAQQMILWNVIFEIERVEQLLLTI